MFFMNKKNAYNFKVRVYFSDMELNNPPFEEFIDVVAVLRDSSDFIIHKKDEVWKASISSVKKIEIVM